jgi:4-methyl-5(b-hydroxyethyl)-thiazole monophosphate biosynthesis
MNKVYVFLADGFETVEALAPVDVMRRAGLDVVTVSIMGRKEVLSAQNVTVAADELYENVCFGDADALVLPGGGVGTDNLSAYEPLRALLVDACSRGLLVAAICAAPGFVLATHGIITKDVKATGYPGCSDNIENYVDAKVVNDKEHKIITSKGPSTAIEFALEILAAIQNQETADKVATDMLLK